MYSWQDQLFLRWAEQTDWPPNYKRVLRLLFEHQRKHGRVFLFYKTIATWLHLSVKTVQRAVRFLSDLGLVEVQHRLTQAGDLGANYFKVIPHILAFPTTHDDAATGHAVATPSVVDRAEARTGPSFPVTVDNSNHKELSSKEINNTPTESLTSQTTVVVPDSHSLPELSQDLATLTKTLALKPTFVQSLLRQAPINHVHQLLTWAASCPAHHPARPRHLEAWISAGVRHQWSTPPTWVKPPSPSITYRVLSDEEVHATQARKDSSPAPDWIAVEDFLQSGNPRIEDFLSEVDTRLIVKMGPELARRARVSQGPFWRAACCEVWRQHYATMSFEATG